MFEISISTPALVFPALTVLMLAYTNRFIAISKRVRALHTEHKENPTDRIYAQIQLLKKRLIYIRNMQTLAIVGFLINLVSMFFILLAIKTIGGILFAFSLAFITGSLVVSLYEIHISVNAMSIQLQEDSEEL